MDKKFRRYSEEMTGEPNIISKSWWDVLLYLCAVLIWNRYPKAEGTKRHLYMGLQIAGMVILVVLALLYPTDDGDFFIGMRTSWWGILGLIGWAYLLSAIVFLLFKDNIGALIGMLGLFVLVVVGLQSGALNLPPFLTWLNSQALHFAHASLTLAGIIFSLLFLQSTTTKTYTERIKGMLIMGLFFLAAGYFLEPIGGISKFNSIEPVCVRKGSTITMSVAKDGMPLTQIGSIELNLGNKVYLGLVMCSHDEDAFEEGIYSNVRIIKPALTSSVKPSTVLPHLFVVRMITGINRWRE